MVEFTEETGFQNPELRIVVFRVDGVRLGADTDQIAQMLDPAQAQTMGIDIVPFHKAVSFRSRQVIYSEPRVLLVRCEEGADRARGVVVDKPEDIIAIKTECIHSMPPLIAGSMEKPVLWGVALLDGEIILLSDLQEVVKSPSLSISSLLPTFSGRSFVES